MTWCSCRLQRGAREKDRVKNEQKTDEKTETCAERNVRLECAAWQRLESVARGVRLGCAERNVRLGCAAWQRLESVARGMRLGCAERDVRLECAAWQRLENVVCAARGERLVSWCAARGERLVSWCAARGVRLGATVISGAVNVAKSKKIFKDRIALERKKNVVNPSGSR